MESRRRPRNTLRNPISVGYRIEHDVKEQFDELARRAGVSGAVLFEQLVKNTPLDDRGLPEWWPLQPELLDGELPIRAA